MYKRKATLLRQWRKKPKKYARTYKLEYSKQKEKEGTHANNQI